MSKELFLISLIASNLIPFFTSLKTESMAGNVKESTQNGVNPYISLAS
jgi:hypothetical protein